MDVIHEREAGLDVHKAMIVACVRVTENGKATRTCQTYHTTTDGIKNLLAWLTEKRCPHVALEATGVYWKPVWNILSDGDFELLVRTRLTSKMSRDVRPTSTMPCGSPICSRAA